MTIPPIVIYKIWMETNQRFWPFSKTGKNFNKVQHVKQALRYHKNIPDDWYLVCITNAGVETKLLKDIIL